MGYSWYMEPLSRKMTKTSLLRATPWSRCHGRRPLQLKNPATIIVLMFVALTVVPAAADTYRWKDKDGNTHYGRIVPPEYAHLPYDVLNDAGIVIDHVDDPTQSADAHAMELAEEVEEKKRAPLISEKERQLEADRLLVVQYDSEEEILDLLDKELAHQETDKTIIRHSFTSTNTAIREQIGLAADQQRAGI